MELGRVSKISVFDFPISNCTYHELLTQIKTAISTVHPIHVVTANAAILVTALHDSELKEILCSADIITADGMSLVWAMKLLGVPCKERVTGIDAVYKILEQAQQMRHKVFLLGAKKAIIEKVYSLLTTSYPQLLLAGYRDGYFDDEESVIKLIKTCKPDILLVGMGVPKQEKWIYNNKKVLNVPVVMGIGGSFDVIAGAIPRAPKWMQKTGLEWLFRLLQEPRRLWKRYLITNSIFILRFFYEYIIFLFTKTKKNTK